MLQKTEYNRLPAVFLLHNQPVFFSLFAPMAKVLCTCHSTKSR